jgi:hypothetical protein
VCCIYLIRFKEGLGVPGDIETALYYSSLPAKVTSDEFQVLGAQAVVEQNRIDDRTAPEVSKTGWLVCYFGGWLVGRLVGSLVGSLVWTRSRVAVLVIFASVINSVANV